jgi:MFS family permease
MALLRKEGPLAESYPAAVVLVLLALTPYLVLTTALTPLQPLLSKDVGMGMRGLQLTSGMANAAYAFGAVLGVQLTSRLKVRRVLLSAAVVYVVASVLAALAPTAGCFVAGRVVQGLMTGMLLIAAVPPLVIGWPADKMPITAVVMNLGIFGAVALGPVIGGVAAGGGWWHPLFWVMTAIGVGTVVFALLTYKDQDPQDSDAPVDIVALVLCAGGCAAAFFGVSELIGHHLISTIVLVPVGAGIAMLIAVLAYEHRHPDPLIPVERLATTLPVAGILVAMVGGAGSVALVELTQAAMKLRGVAPAHAGALFWPEVGGALLAAVLFGALFRTRYTPVLAGAGLLLLTAAAVVLTGAAHGGDTLVLVGSGAVGLGVGASVSPALFVAGFSLPSPLLPRVFAMVELLRGVAAFLVAPVLAHVAKTTSGGTRGATWVVFGIAAAGLAAVVCIYLAGGQRLQKPRIEAWSDGSDTAKDSHPLGAAFRAQAAVRTR